MSGLLDMFSREAGQRRRAWLDDKTERGLDWLQYYAGPGVPVRPIAELAGMLNPVNDLYHMQGATRRAVEAEPGERFPHVMDAATNAATFLMPAIGGALTTRAYNRAGGLLADDAARTANVLADTFTSTGQAGKRAARDFVADESGAIRAYHGSPHDFDRFRMDRIGTGEGAQAYGHGLYFAENEGVARMYRDTVGAQHRGRSANWDDPQSIAEYWAGMYGGRDEGISYLEGAIRAQQRNPRTTTPRDMELTERALDYLRNTENLPTSGRMYEVNIHARPEDFIDFHSRGATTQPEGLRRLAEEHMGTVPDQSAEGILQWIDGSMARQRGQYPPTSGFSPELTQELSRRGIPGIRYHDAGSRAAGEGTRNYVVFDENLIEIVRKYGIAGAASMLGVTASEVEAAMQPRGLLSQ